MQGSLPSAIWSRVGRQWALLTGHTMTLQHRWCVWAAHGVVGKTEPHCRVWGQPLVGRWDGTGSPFTPDAWQVFSAVHKEDSGQYYCIASNDAGSAWVKLKAEGTVWERTRWLDGITTQRT